MKNRPLKRRIFLTSLFVLPHSMTAAVEPAPIRSWLVGRWRSDRDRTLQSWYFEGEKITADQRDRAGQVFGHMSYTITQRTFHLQHNDYVVTERYTVVSETSSSITIRLHSPEAHAQVTLFRAGENELFIKIGKNREYFRRVAA